MTTPEGARAEALRIIVEFEERFKFVSSWGRDDLIERIATALSRAAQGAPPLDVVLAIFDNFYAPDDPWAQACRKQLAALRTP